MEDSNQLSRVVMNLIANAVLYTPSGRILLQTGFTPDPGSVFLSVQDTGVEIAEKDLP